MLRYDIYLAHASEDKALASSLRDALAHRGLAVWFNAFIVGPSVRVQMERGLRESEYGIVLLSNSFFEKRWAIEELEGMLALEKAERPRILPVWAGIGYQDVLSFSPMLAMRNASVMRDSSQAAVDGTADELLESVLQLSAGTGPAHLLRAQIASGIRWTNLELIPDSFRAYAEFYESEFLVTELIHYPDLPTRQRPVGDPIPLPELLRAPVSFAGRRVSTVAHQAVETVHVLDVRGSLDTGVELASYVFQLVSNAWHDPDVTCYVHCIGPYSRAGGGGWGPYGPQDWLCWVTGLPLAVGTVPTRQGRTIRAVYLAASWVMFTPPVDIDSDNAT